VTQLRIGLLKGANNIRPAGNSVKDKAVAYGQEILEEEGFEVHQIERGPALLGDLMELDVDFVLGVSSLAEAATLQEIAIPYAGPRPTVIATAMDNSVTKVLWQRMGLPTPPFLVAETLDDCEIFAKDPPFEWPLSIRPAVDSNRIGMDGMLVVEEYEQLGGILCELITELSRPVLIEQFSPGREVLLGLVGNGDAVTILPPLEILRPDSGRSDIRPVADAERLICPASLSEEQMDMLGLLALRTYNILRFRDAARLDVVLTAEGPMLLGANPFVRLPSTPEDSDSPLGLMADAISKNIVSQLAHVAARRLGLEPVDSTEEE
jgi:D-alanine-D-alanine ligase